MPTFPVFADAVYKLFPLVMPVVVAVLTCVFTQQHTIRDWCANLVLASLSYDAWLVSAMDTKEVIFLAVLVHCAAYAACTRPKEKLVSPLHVGGPTPGMVMAVATSLALVGVIHGLLWGSDLWGKLASR